MWGNKLTFWLGKYAAIRRGWKLAEGVNVALDCDGEKQQIRALCCIKLQSVE